MATTDTSTEQASESFNCPISFALDFFGDRWSLLLIRDMMLRGKKRYGEFLRSPEGISTNILADRLKRMQQQGLVQKFADPDNRKASLYLLTDKGLDLFPILLEVIRWGLEHDEHSVVLSSVATAVTGNGEDLARQCRERISSERLALESRNQA